MSANGVLKDCKIKVSLIPNSDEILKLLKKKNELIGLHFVDTHARSCRRPWGRSRVWRGVRNGYREEIGLPVTDNGQLKLQKE